MPTIEQNLAGWGRLPVERCHVATPDSLSALRQTLGDSGHSSYIARGLGRAYGDSSLNADRGVVLQTARDRLLGFDEATGILACESGVSLAEVIRCMLPRGWFLPITPGTKFVTVGGAIAADVHGKNHHVDGSFGEHVIDLELLLASGEVLTCSPSQHADIFWATVGGMGLTGVILSARVRLHRVETAYYDVVYRRTRDIDHTLRTFAETDTSYRYSVAWIDCLQGGSGLGRSVLMLARDAAVSDLPAERRARPLVLPAKHRFSVPCEFPGFALNPWSVKAFNSLYYGLHRDTQKIVDYDTFFYPLDHLLHWNRVYGRRGFVQYQALFPRETSREGLVRLLERLAKSRGASFLAVLKSSGAASSGWLSYLYPGHTLALDLPNNSGLPKLVRQLDEILLAHGGRLYLAKDAMMTPDAFAQMYPRLAEFQRLKQKLDPDGLFASSQARRVGIVADA